MTLTWTIIPGTVNFPPGVVACGGTEPLALSTDGNVTTATVPTYHPCGGTATIESYTLTLVGWQKMLGKDNSGGTSCSWFCGDPIDIATGNVFETFKDYETAGANKLSLIRYYNSYQPPPSSGPTVSFTLPRVIASPNWTTNYDGALIVSGTQATAFRPDGEELTFNLKGNVWTPDTDVDMTLTANGNVWTLTGHDDTTETYDVSPAPNLPSIGIGRLAAITVRNGYRQTLTYAATGLLTSVADPYGRQLTFGYTGNLLTKVTTPDTLVLTYGYNSSGLSPGVNDRLASVSYNTAPASGQSYHYDDGSFPLSLTSIIDEDGNLFASFAYDGYNRGISSQRAGGADLTTLTFNDKLGTRTVQNALGQQHTYSFVSLQGVNKVTQVKRLAKGTVAAGTMSLTYDSNGYLASQTDWNGNKTTYVNDGHGDPLTIVEAAGTPVARATTIVYDAAFAHLPSLISTPGLSISFVYDASGEVNTKTITDTTTTTAPYSTNGQSRVWTNSWANFQLASTKGPRTDATQLTSFTYDASGALTATTNARNQTTKITAHTGGGLPTAMIDPNGVKSAMVYDARQRLQTTTLKTAAGLLTTTFGYDPAGNVVRVTQPDGSALANSYDAAHRLTRITDLFNQSTNYTLDGLGDRTQTTLTSASNSIPRKHANSYDSLGRTLKDTGGMAQATSFTYDANGNALTITNPLGRVTRQVFDALNRRIKVTNPDGGVTTTSYDAHDRPLTVTDPNGNVTHYVYNGFGDVIEQVSPDSGTTVYHYDSASNLTQKVDAAGNVTNHTYDALDRMLTTTYPADAAENIAYSYDQPGHGFGVGRMTSLTDAAGSLSRTYDERGNLLIDTRVSGLKTFKTAYSYDAASRIKAITYPSGWTVSYSRDAMGRVTQMPISKPGGAGVGNAIANATYEPFGPLAALSYGNGVNETRQWDLDYRITSLADTGSHAIQNLTYKYYGDNNVFSIADAVTPGNSQSFTYDLVGRLANAKGAYGSFAWSYDKVGNRTKQTLAVATTTYQYTPGSNRLSSITAGGVTTPVTYTATGNINSIPSAPGNSAATLAYNAANRLKTVIGTPLAITGTTYDAFGQRFSKTSGGTSNYFTYGRDTSLLEENDNGSAIDYLYLDGRPVAEILPASGKVYFLHDDRLGTPQVATDSTQAVAWSGTYQPFGEAAVVASISQNLRFPGQYFDAETGFSYNVNRDYLPNIGRYLESDPIGISGGINTFGYVGANPLMEIDPSGLCVGIVARLLALLANESGIDLGLEALLNRLASGAVAEETAVAISRDPDAEQQFEQNIQRYEEAIAQYKAAQAGDDSIVLGLRNFGLSDTAEQIGARTLLNDPDWQITLQTALGNSNVGITVSLDGVSGSSPYTQFMNAAQSGLGGSPVSGQYFNWEMGQIYQAGRQSSVTFMQGGQVLSNPFQ